MYGLVTMLTILQGVTIDEGIVIGVGSVVTKNIPSRVVTAGNPCKIIRKITEKDKSRYLESLKHELKCFIFILKKKKIKYILILFINLYIIPL